MIEYSLVGHSNLLPHYKMYFYGMKSITVNNYIVENENDIKDNNIIWKTCVITLYLTKNRQEDDVKWWRER